MKNKSILLFSVILLLVHTFSFAQVANPYAEFAPEELKKNKEYMKNFNPITFNAKVLYNCMIDMVNVARTEYSFAYKMKHDIKLDSTAQMQADYMAKKDEKTEFNAAPYKTLNFRLTKYGLSKQGVELVTKAKASMGVNEYSYYDLCLELIKPILKSLRTAQVLLDRQYTYMGFGYQFDINMRSVYASFVLGNDLTFLPYQAALIEKGLPYTKRSGLSNFDPRVCQKCQHDISLEQLSNCVSVKNDDIIFSCDDYKILRKLIGREGDAIVLDFVQNSQYACEQTVVNNDYPYRGFITKPFTYNDLISKNEITDKKSVKLLATIGKVPEELPVGADYDINMIILKEGKYACRTILKRAVEMKNADYEEKVNFYKDETTIKNAGEWVASPEETTFELIIPFVTGKTEYKFSDFDSLVTQMNLPAYTLKRVEIVAQNSLNYAKDPAQAKIQQKRAESIAKAFTTTYPGVKTAISYDDSWEDFKKDVVNSEEYYYLVLEKKEDAIRLLKANNNKIAKELEPYLANHRYAKVVMHVVLETDGRKEEEYALYKFNRAIKEKNFPLAMSIQKFIIKNVESGSFNGALATRMDIPEEKSNQAFLINKLYLEFFAMTKMDDKIAHNMGKVYRLNQTNPVAVFNMSVVDLYTGTITSLQNITNTQATVDKLYALAGLSKERVNSLNMEYQLKFITYLAKQPQTTENAAALDATYLKVKAVKNPALDTWQNAYKLASYFVKNNDFMYAIELMVPFLQDKTISEDFLFSFVSLAAHRPETYLSSPFTQAVAMATGKNVKRLCGLFDRFPISVFDNEEVKNSVCKSCNR